MTVMTHEVGGGKRNKFHTGYRTAFHFDLHSRETTVGVAETTVRDWLAGKRIDPAALDGWDGRSNVTFPDGLNIRVAYVSNERDQSEGILYRVFDRNGDTTYRTTIYAIDHAESRKHAAVFVIEGATDQGTVDDAVDSIGSARFINDLLNSREVFDSNTRLPGEPQVIHSADVDEVRDAIFDSGRQIAVVVASSVSLEGDEKWRKVVASLTHDSVGTAATFVVSYDAVDPLNEILPDHLQVPAGRIRTFMPGVSMEDPNDGIRHRYVGPAALAKALGTGGSTHVKGFLPKLHARSTRLPLLSKGLPSWTNRRLQLLEEEERRLAREMEVRERLARKRDTLVSEEQVVVSVEKPVPTEPSIPFPKRKHRESKVRDWFTSFRERVANWLERDPDEVTEDNFDVVLEDLERRIDDDRESLTYHQELLTETDEEISDLKQQLVVKNDQVESAEEDAALLQLELDEVRAKNNYLRHQLAKLNVYPSGDEEIDDEEFWKGVEDLDEALAKLVSADVPESLRGRIEFTGDMKIVDMLVRRDRHGNYARETWSIIRALAGYIEVVESGRSDLSVDSYLKDQSAPGYRVSARRHAPRESDAVRNNPKWRAEREFRVPEKVDSSGRTMMEAHFRIASDSVAPRLYYLDRYSQDKKIYIGYIGPHLTNTKTN